MHTHTMKVLGEKLTRIDYITLGFIAFLTIILILNWSFLPTSELDTPYHLLMGKMFADYDTVMLWDYYEYAPIGRPNLYPPLEHILLWWMHDLTGVDWWNIGRFVSLIQYPLPMVAVWFFCRKIFNPVTALASVVFLSVSIEFWFWQVSVAPTSLIVSLFPFFLYSFYRKKVLTSILLLTSFLYLHLGLPYVVILCAFLFSLFSLYKTREYMKHFAIVTGASVLLFLPWIIHILMYQDWLGFGGHRAFDPLSLLFGINILTAIFTVFGILKCLDRVKVDLKYLLVLSAFVGFFAVAFYGWRYKMHSPIINCIIAGIGFETIYCGILERTAVSRKKVAAVLLLLLIPLGAFSINVFPAGPSNPGPVPQPQPQLQNQPFPQPPMQPLNQNLPNHPVQQPPNQPKNQPKNQLPLPQQQFQPVKQPKKPLEPKTPLFQVQRSPLLEMLKSLKTGERPPRSWQITNPEIDALIQWIIDNTSEDEILHVQNGMLADYLALHTDRRTDSGMYREVNQPELMQAIQEGKKSGIVIMEAKEFPGQPPPGITIIEQFGNMLVLQGMKPEHIPSQIPFRLKDFFLLLEKPEPHTVTQWATTIAHIRPRHVYVGIRQKDVKNPEVQHLIDELNRSCNVGLSIIVEDGDPQNITSLPGITTLRLVMPQEKISPEFVESVRNSLDSKIGLEIAILVENTSS